MENVTLDVEIYSVGHRGGARPIGEISGAAGARGNRAARPNDCDRHVGPQRDVRFAPHGASGPLDARRRVLHAHWLAFDYGNVIGPLRPHAVLPCTS